MNIQLLNWLPNVMQEFLKNASNGKNETEKEEVDLLLQVSEEWIIRLALVVFLLSTTQGWRVCECEGGMLVIERNVNGSMKVLC